jgi:hypothetical protein
MFESDETFGIDVCNISLKHLQHTCNIPIYFYNIHIKHLQHTYETSEILQTCICNIRILLPWCLRPTAGDNVPTGDDLLPVALWWWWHSACRGHDEAEWGGAAMHSAG